MSVEDTDLYSIDQLTAIVAEVWTSRQHYSEQVRSVRQCIRGLDSRLGQMLFQVRLMLVKPGRNGGWSSWLAKHGISRATADRLAIRFAKSRSLQDDDVLNNHPGHEPAVDEVGTPPHQTKSADGEYTEVL